MNLIDALTAWLVILQIFDAWTTIAILKQGGREANPVLAKLFNKFGPVAVLCATKAAAIALIVWLHSEDQLYIIGALAVIFTAVVINNLRQVKR